MKLVFLDAKTIGSDINLSAFETLGEVVYYDFTTPDEASIRSRDADVLIVNKTEINAKTIGEASHVKRICVTASGTKNLDKDYLKSRGISWRNVAGYSTDSVAQHTFAMLFYLLEKMRYYDDYVKEERYVSDRIFTHFAEHFHELAPCAWGSSDLEILGERLHRLPPPSVQTSYTTLLPTSRLRRAIIR